MLLMLVDMFACSMGVCKSGIYWNLIRMHICLRFNSHVYCNSEVEENMCFFSIESVYVLCLVVICGEFGIK